jgi:transcriptional regulator with XRE-family HTH domain
MSSSAIKKIRKSLKLTQRAAAALVNVSPNTWARWERGESKPRGLHQRRLITNLPLSFRRGNSQRVRATLSSPVSSKPHRMPHATGATLMKFLGTWAGDDAEQCLKLVYAMRGKARF